MDDGVYFRVTKDEVLVREALFCPISMELISDPVVTQDGHCYDRKNLLQWFDLNETKTSPLTNMPITAQPRYFELIDMRNTLTTIFEKAYELYKHKQFLRSQALLEENIMDITEVCGREPKSQKGTRRVSM